MANNSLTGITRDQLKQFLPDHQTIIAFENLLKFAGETAPDQIEALISLISGIKRINATDINSRLSALEVPTTRGANLSSVNQRLGDLESLPTSRGVNFSSIYARLDALEAAQIRRDNLQPVIARIENIEKTLGI
jgi:hypothetical protein